MKLYIEYIAQDGIESYRECTGKTLNYMDFYKMLSSRVNIEDVVGNPDLPWYRCQLSRNEQISLEDVQLIEETCTNLQYYWDYKSLQYDNRDWAEEADIIQNWGEYEESGFNYTEELIQEILKCHSIGKMKNLDYDRINHPFPSFYKSPVKYGIYCLRYDLSRSVDMNHVIMNPKFPWNLHALSENERLTMEVLTMHLPNAYNRWNVYEYTTNIIDLPFTKIDKSGRYYLKTHTRDSVGEYDLHVSNGSSAYEYEYEYEKQKLYPYIQFDLKAMFYRNDLRGPIMICVNPERINSSKILNNIHYNWNFNEIVMTKNLPLRLALLGKRAGNIFRPINFTKTYHDIDIICT